MSIAVLDQRTVTSRKVHQCDLCLCEIARGERCDVSTMSTPDSGIYRWRQHEDCTRIGRRMLAEWDLPEGYRDEDLTEWLFGGYFDEDHDDEDDRCVRERIMLRRAQQATARA
jgi:hypothetical protein